MQYTLNPTLPDVTAVPTRGVPRPVVRKAGRVQRFSLSWFLLRMLFCVLPTALLLGRGHANLAGYYFWGTFGLLLLTAGMRGRRDEVLALLIALAPFINLMRAFAFYNVILVLFGGAWL